MDCPPRLLERVEVQCDVIVVDIEHELQDSFTFWTAASGEIVRSIH